MKAEVKSFLDIVLETIRTEESNNVQERIKTKFQTKLKTMIEGGILSEKDAKEYATSAGMKLPTASVTREFIDPCSRGGGGTPNRC
ncbi:MAG: hypothetical protein PHW03_02755 [Eubacteriales bacterium]|nr:hypothetical protein [Eubacteriales bacterium]